MSDYGILGGGQLSQMLAQSANKLGIRPRVWVLSKNDPVTKFDIDVFEGDTKSTDTVEKFSRGLRSILIESEFWDLSGFLAHRSRFENLFFPSLASIILTRDKLSQKLKLRELGVATSEFQKWDPSQESAEAFLKKLGQDFADGYVLKWSRGGYDGKGVFLVPSIKNLQKQDALKFMADGQKSGQVYAEKCIRFTRELAMVACRGRGGEFKHFPLTEHESDRGICYFVKGPATRFGVLPEIEKRAASFMQRVGEGFGLQGVFAVEFFLGSSGELWVNEIAPRVHNTGHYSQDACDRSQFEVHLLAAADEKFEQPQSCGIFGMLNLLGPEGVQLAGDRAPQNPGHGLFLHWYHKFGIQPRRKLGHLNFVAKDTEEFKKRLSHAKAYESDWKASLASSQ